MRKMEDEMRAYEERFAQSEEEVDQMKQDMQLVVSYKNELEEIVDQQTATLSQTSKRASAIEDQMRLKDADFEKQEAALRRANESNAETKKKLMQAEVKIR